MTSTNHQPEIRMRDTWIMAAEDVLSVLMAEPAAFGRAAFGRGLLGLHFPPGQLRDLYMAVSEIRLTNTDEHDNPLPVSDTTLLHVAKQKVDEPTVNEIRRMYDPERSAGFDANVSILMQHGRAAHAADRLARARKAIIAGGDLDKVVGQLLGDLELEVGQTVEDATARAALASFRAQIAAGPMTTFSTGIPIIDELTGGIWRKMIAWLAGQYKGGKSSAMRTAILGTLRDGASVTLITLEGYREMIVAQFISMLMAEWLLENGLYHATRPHNGADVLLRDIGPLNIMIAGADYLNLWTPEQIAARQWAERQFEAFDDRLRLYDPLPKHGRASDIESINSLILKDVRQYGADVVWIDYLQRIKRSPGQSYFDMMDTAALDLQDTALSQNVAIGILAQLSEESIKSNTAGKGNGTPGVKGGGTPAATADGLWLVGGDDDDYNPADPLFRMELRLSRYAASSKRGATQEAYYHIHAPSGYIIPQKYVAQYWSTVDLSAY